MASVPLAAIPVMGEIVDEVQVKVVPTTVEVRFTRVLVTPEQSVCSRGQFVTVGLGLMVTTWVVVVPGHPWYAEVML